MLDRTAGQLQAMLKTKTFAVTRRSVDLLLDWLPIVGMNSREDKFQGRFCPWIAFEDSEGLVGPEVFGGGNVPPKTACVAEPLRLGKMCLSTLQFLGQSLMQLSFSVEVEAGDDHSFVRLALIHSPT